MNFMFLLGVESLKWDIDVFKNYRFMIDLSDGIKWNVQNLI